MPEISVTVVVDGVTEPKERLSMVLVIWTVSCGVADVEFIGFPRSDDLATSKIVVQ